MPPISFEGYSDKGLQAKITRKRTALTNLTTIIEESDCSEETLKKFKINRVRMTDVLSQLERELDRRISETQTKVFEAA